jgi:hypothetical protein
MMRNQTSLRFADKVIMATPQLSINTFKDRKNQRFSLHRFGTLVVSELPDNGSFPLCWDNVWFKRVVYLRSTPNVESKSKR